LGGFKNTPAFIYPVRTEDLPGCNWCLLSITELEFLKSVWGLGTEEEKGYRTCPPGYIGWRNSFLEIYSGAPYTFKKTGSGLVAVGHG
jgi:hypothetical protein